MPGAQDKPSLDAFVGALGPADFNNGYSRVTDALDLALDYFATDGISGANKYIFILTDGTPTAGFEPATIDPLTGQTDYVSDSLQAVRDQGITTAAVGFALTQSAIENFFTAVPDSPELFFSGTGFNDFSDFLPGAETVAMPAPSALLFLLAGAGLLAARRGGAR